MKLKIAEDVIDTTGEASAVATVWHTIEIPKDWVVSTEYPPGLEPKKTKETDHA